MLHTPLGSGKDPLLERTRREPSSNLKAAPQRRIPRLSPPHFVHLPGPTALLLPTTLPGVPGDVGVPPGILSAGSHPRGGERGDHFPCSPSGSFFYNSGDPWRPPSYVWGQGPEGMYAWLGALTEMRMRHVSQGT